MIDLEKYVSGTTSYQKKIDKSNKDFVFEWFSSLSRTKYLVFLLISLLGGSYVFNFYGLKIAVSEYVPILGPVFVVLGILMFPLVVTACLILLVRTVGVVSSFFTKEIHARSLILSESGIQILKADGQLDEYPFDDVHNIQVIYNARSLIISAPKFISYALRAEPKDIEIQLDTLKGFLKQVTFLESREGYVRWVYYRNPAHEGENQSFIAANSKLPPNLDA